MKDLSQFLLVGLILNITPGPDMLYVMARSVDQGRKAGLVSALGISVGSLVHTTAATIGISALLMSSTFAYTVVKFAGAAYLIYLGLQTILSKEGNRASKAPEATDLMRIFRQAVLINVCNPKVALFFLAFLPQFVDPSKGAVAWQIITLGIIFNATGTLCLVIIGWLAGLASFRLSNRSGFVRLQRWFTATVLIALGFRLLILN